MRKTTLGLTALLAFSLGGMVQAADVKTKLPISDKPITLTFWAPMDTNVRSVNNNYANTEYY